MKKLLQIVTKMTIAKDAASLLLKNSIMLVANQIKHVNFNQYLAKIV